MYVRLWKAMAAGFFMLALWLFMSMTHSAAPCRGGFCYAADCRGQTQRQGRTARTRHRLPYRHGCRSRYACA